jgi:aspartyl/asparaginyl-tRNA synthetase
VNFSERKDEGVGLIGQEILVAGWVRTKRMGGKDRFAFIKLYDGTCFGELQVHTTTTHTLSHTQTNKQTNTLSLHHIHFLLSHLL